jgi:hypothetical protein
MSRIPNIATKTKILFTFEIFARHKRGIIKAQELPDPDPKHSFLVSPLLACGLVVLLRL